MPVTAKFSKEFYDRLGHDVVDELVTFLNAMDSTYRSRLRDLNDLNFARFDAKLEQRVEQLDAKIAWRVAELDVKIERRATELRAEFRSGLSALKADLIKWMFLFWAVTTFSVLETLVAFLRP